MAIAPIIGVAVGAAGTVASISQQSAAARRQSQAIANQELIARDNLKLKELQLEQAKETNERRFVREKAVLDAQTAQARINLGIQQEQAKLETVQQQLQIDTLEAQSRQQAAQLLSAAEAGQTEAVGANIQDLFALARQLEGSDEAASNFIANAVSRLGGGQLSETFRNVLNLNALEDIAEGQRVRETTIGRTRVAQSQGDVQRGQAEIVKQQGILSTDYLTSLQDLQSRANDIAFRQASFDINNTAAQNLAGLEAAKFASQAELEVARGANALEFRSQQAALDAQRASIQRPNIFGSVANLGFQAFNAFSQPTLLQAPQPVFSNTSGVNFSSATSPAINTSNLSFGGSFTTGL